MKQYFSFKGRIGRLEYFISFIIYWLYCVAIGFFIGFWFGFYEGYNGIYTGEGASVTTNILLFVLLIPNFWFLLAQGAKRCHDIGKGGLFQIIPLYILWMLIEAGEEGTNEYGKNPAQQFEQTEEDYEGGSTPTNIEEEISDTDNKPPAKVHKAKIASISYWLYCLKHYVDFKGRASKAECFNFLITNILLNFAAIILFITMAKFMDLDIVQFYIEMQMIPNYIIYIFNLAMLLPTLAVLIRRMHDTGKDGRLMMAVIIVGIVALPVSFILNNAVLDLAKTIYIILALIWLIFQIRKPSQEGNNKWGTTAIIESSPQNDNK
jgi:uncharacterized membrane protein YhaH (DUF805 family)